MVYFIRLEETADKKQSHLLERKVASALLRWVCETKLPGELPEDIRSLLEIGVHGKPYLKGNPFYFNLSHSGGIVLCAVEHCEVGIDVEKKRLFTDRLKRRICTPNELKLLRAGEEEHDDLTRLWTMKESYMKYTGLGFAQGILSTEFDVLGNTPHLKTGDGCFASVELPDAFVTLCTREPVALDFCFLEISHLPEI